MKLHIYFGILSLLASFQTYACSPTLPSLFQKMNLSRVLESKSFEAELSRQQAMDPYIQIKSIEMEGAISVTLSNNCIIVSTSKFAPAQSPGMCPEFIGVESDTICHL